MYEFDRSAPVTVALSVRTGEVSVFAEERGTVQVDVRPLGDDAEEAADRTRVVLDGDTLLIDVPNSGAWTWRRSAKLRITVRVPVGSSLTGKSASADVRATGTFGTVRLDVASADVTVDEITGDIEVDAASGDVRLGRVGGALRVKSASGDLRIGDVTGDVNLDTASGDIRLRAADGSLRATSASGDIEVGRLRQGQASVRTASGDVQIGIAAGTGVWLDLNTASGRSIGDLSRQDETGEGGGTATLELRVRTASGDIRVHRAADERKAA